VKDIAVCQIAPANWQNSADVRQHCSAIPTTSGLP